MYRSAFRQPRVLSPAGAEHRLTQLSCIRPWTLLPLPSRPNPKQTNRPARTPAGAVSNIEYLGQTEVGGAVAEHEGRSSRFKGRRSLTVGSYRQIMKLCGQKTAEYVQHQTKRNSEPADRWRSGLFYLSTLQSSLPDYIFKQRTVADQNATFSASYSSFYQIQ